jgi:hypothetical protein
MVVKSNIPIFHACTVKHNGRANRITTPVKVCQAFDTANPPTPPPPFHETTALWDTGATGSVITKATADAMGLIPVGTALINHAGGSSQANTFVVNFLLPNNVVVAGVRVSECEDIAGNFGAIIGMDIITQGDLSITNVHGQTCMSFRIPSINAIDYVIEANRLTFAGVGRNDPCPCGKKDSLGKSLKFKKCCGRNRS